MINFEKQFDNIESKFMDIENNLNNQIDIDTEKLIKLNKEYAELTPIVVLMKEFHFHFHFVYFYFDKIDI